MYGGGGGGGDDALAARLGLISPSLLIPTTSMISREMSPAPVREERLPSQPQWSQQETREFIAIRAELERDFTASKRNKTLWEVVSSKMRERGYRRSPEQCKCKWKNLVNRYKGKETSDPEHGKQCPFFEELHAVFTERAHNMQRLLLESETRPAQAKKGVKRTSGYRSSEEFSEDDEEVEDDSEEEKPARSNTRKRKASKIAMEKTSRANNASSSNSNVQEMLKDFFQQQLRMEMQWREMMERRAHERQLFEQEWRQSMEKLERERLMIEQEWREREEHRRLREESRAERRDALLTTLLNRLTHESN